MKRNLSGSFARAGFRALVILAVLSAAALVYLRIWSRSRDTLVVYCAHDSVYAETVLRRFTRESGIPVAPVYDTEATKSLGLVERLKAERNAPRCDVFWNNQVLGTMELAREGILEPYKGSGYERIPEKFRDPDGLWTGFAARLRVYIVNTDKMPATEASVKKALDGNLSRVAVAKPLYGTTLSHYAVLMKKWGPEKLRNWHADWRRRDVCEVLGNATVKNLVAEGVCDLGLTDTDDFFVASDAGKPVAMLPVRLKDGSVICIPNSVCIMKGTGRRDAARKLVDYLLSARSELALAEAASRQIPLGPVEASSLSPEVRQLRTWSRDGVALTTELLDARRSCLTWLKSEHLK